MIPYGRQDITQSDIDAVVSVLHSDFLTQGPVVPKFERTVAEHVGAKYAVAVNSATSALHIACIALRLGKDDLLWTVPNTFAASANCALYCGAEVDFVDIDPIFWNLSVQRLKEKLVAAKKRNRLPNIVVPVHFGGQPTQQEEIWELSQEYGFKVLEDASHSIGATRLGEAVGSCRWSDATVFSFHPVKIVTSGEGGIVLTNNVDTAKRMEMLRTHGITRDKSRFLTCDTSMDTNSQQQVEPGGWHYEQQMLGFNYRLTDLHAALGVSQMSRLENYVARRNKLASQYNEALKSLPLTLPKVEAKNQSAHHLYVVRLPRNSSAERQKCVYDALRQRQIGANVHYTPVHLHPYYQRLGFSAGQFPESEAHGVSAITLPLFATLSDQDQCKVVQAIQDVL